MSELPAFAEDFNARIKEAEVFLSIARASELQRESKGALQQMQSEIGAQKTAAVEAQDEDSANMLLGYECVTDVLIAELDMWLLLKEEDPDKAWDALVKAQMASVAAARAHDGFKHLAYHHRRLEAIEQLVFPPQVFVSSGMIVKHQECSICGEEYEDCEHLAGKPYMGRFCHIIARDLEIDHIAIVEEPADKCCRATQFEVDGGVRNRMTWRIEPVEK